MNKSEKGKLKKCIFKILCCSQEPKLNSDYFDFEEIYYISEILSAKIFIKNKKLIKQLNQHSI